MAREFKEIKKSITDRFIAIASVQALYGLTPGNSFEEEFSLVSLESMLFDVVAFSIFTLEKMWDIFTAEQDEAIARQKLGSLTWYRDRSLDYQHGQAVIDDGVYDTTGDTPEEIEARKIVAHAAVEERGRFLHIKLAKEDADDLVPLTEPEVEGFETYINHVKFAGTRIKVISLPPDDFRVFLDIYYDPAVLNQDGKRKDGTNDTPVQDAIETYLKELQFNGAYIGTRFINFLESIEGVKMPVLRLAQARYGGLPWEIVHEVYYSEAGYMRIDGNYVITQDQSRSSRTVQTVQYPDDQSYLNFISFYERT